MVDTLEISNVIFDESYVLGIHTNDCAVNFVCDFALLPGHPEYFTPRINERHCYTNGSLIFKSFVSYEWLEKHMKLIPSDLDDPLDYGTIDELYKDGDCFLISGEWGRIKIIGGNYEMFFRS